MFPGASPSDYFKGDGITGELFYSYKTCDGDENLWRKFTNERRYHNQLSKGLRVVVLPSAPYVNLRVTPDPSLQFPFNKYEGLMIDVLAKFNVFHETSTASCSANMVPLPDALNDIVMIVYTSMYCLLAVLHLSS